MSEQIIEDLRTELEACRRQLAEEGETLVRGVEVFARLASERDERISALEYEVSELKRAALTVLNAIDARLVGDHPGGHWTTEMQIAHDVALETLARMVGR